MTDQQIIARLKSGELSGLEDLVRLYQSKAVRVAFLIVQDEPLAEDIVIDTFLHLAHHIDAFDESRPFEPYLMRSLVNAALNAMRHPSISLDGRQAAQHLDELLAEASTLEEQIESNETRREIQSAISRLAPRQRAAVVLRYYLQMSETEISTTLDSPTGTIKWLLNSARSRLREILAPKGK